MILLLLLYSILQFALCSCPDGFDLVRDGQCRGKYVTDVSLPVNTAINTTILKCSEIKGQPVIIHNDEQQSYWKSRATPGDGAPWLILGLVCNKTSKRFEWSDGSAVDYTPPEGIVGISDIHNFDCTTRSDCSYWLYSDGSWSYSCGTGSPRWDIFCTTQLPVLTFDGCDSFEEDGEDGVCYQIGTTAENWQDAQMSCKKVGANLASIHNAQENSFLRRLAVSKGDTYGVFLGATIAGKGNSYGWVDGSDWDYDNFYPGFPKTGFGDCIALDTSTSTGQWMNIDCSAKIPVACIRDQKAAVEPTCSTDSWKEETIITSPGFPYTASTPCDYYLTADAGKLVELEVILLEANSCCDSLVLYDGYFGGVVMANLTGEIRNVTYKTTSSNIMRVSWQPKGGVGVMGMAMTFRGV